MIEFVKNISNFLFGERDFFRFQNASFFILILFLISFFVVQWMLLKRKKRVLKKLVSEEHLTTLFPNNVKGRSKLKRILWGLGMLCLIIGVVGPQFGTKKEEVLQKGVDVVFALDVSKSMLADDIKPSRLLRAKHAIGKVIDRLGSDRVAIVVFAGDAYIQLPLTSDHGAAKMYLDEIDVNLIPIGGTSLSRAREKSLEAFSSEDPSGAIIMITDGEDQDEEALAMAKKCKDAGVKVYTLGIGTAEGSTIPELVNGKKIGRKKDQFGSTVVSKINEPLLIEISQEGGGEYIRANNQNIGLESLYEQIKGLDQDEYGAKKFTSYEHRFQGFLLLGMLLLVVEFFVFDNKWNKNDA